MRYFPKAIFRMFLCLAFVQAIFSCRDTLDMPQTVDDTPVDTARCMTLVYIMAENSLSGFADKDIREIKAGATDVPNDCHMIVFVDDRKSPRILRIYNKEGEAVCDTMSVFEQDFCSSDTLSMRMVFDRIYEEFPAKSLNLVLWSHGSGWIRNPQSAPMQRSIGVDNEQNSYSNTSTRVIEIDELATLLCDLPVGVELLMFDACFMQSVEVAYALRNSANWILASPAEIPGDGAPYDRIMAALFSVPFNAEDVMNSYYDAYKTDNAGVLLSLVKCDAMDEFADVTSRYIPQAFARSRNIEYSSLFSYLPDGYFDGLTLYYPDYTDINSAMKANLTNFDYLEWKNSLDRAVPFSVASSSWYSLPHRNFYDVDNDVYCGVSMYIPRDNALFETYNVDFFKTEWYDAAGWNQTGW